MNFRIVPAISAALLLSFAWLAPSPVLAASAGGQIVLPTDTVRSGDLFTVQVKVDAPQSAHVELLGWPDVLAPADVADWQVNGNVWTAHVRTFTPGSFTVGPLQAQAIGGDSSQTDTLRFDIAPASFVIHSWQADTVTTLLDVEPPLADPHWPWWAWTLIALAAAAALAILLWKLWPRKQQKMAAKPLLPPYEEALEALQALRTRDLLGLGDQAQYFTELGFIVRRYLERRFGVEALDATTLELRQRLAHVKGLAQTWRESTARFAAESDLVKFARLPMDSEKARAWDTWAERLLHDTRPQPEPTSAGSGGATPAETK